MSLENCEESNRGSKGWLLKAFCSCTNLFVFAFIAFSTNASTFSEVKAKKTAAIATSFRPECDDFEPLRQAYFGDLHVHTAYSFDAYAWETRNDPAQAYLFARGEALDIAPLDEYGQGTVTIQLDRPLDFAAVTDHSEFLGEVNLCVTPGSESYDTRACQLYRTGGKIGVIGMTSRILSPLPHRSPFLCGDDGSTCLQTAAGPWQRIQEAAAAANDACAFTSFVGYEYTGMPFGAMLHRNVIFRGESVPELPVSYLEAPTPEDLWTRLDAVCTDAGTGCEVLAIPHNPNFSQGRIFNVEYGGNSDPVIQAEIAARRARLEPIMEVYQHKGSSECAFPFFTSDEECSFELLSEEENEDPGFPPQESDFLRGALALGLNESLRLGVNPFKLGVIGSTDTHNASPGEVNEANWQGHVGKEDSDVANSRISFSPGGLVGVWAEENTRDALFQAMQRRETFGTSGPRIRVRFFGGWDYDEGLCTAPDMLQQAYKNGVPMGSDLPDTNTDHGSPRFILQAMQDDIPLQVAQIIKIWLDQDGSVHEKVFDVNGDRENGAGVDPHTCIRNGSGAPHLCSVWQDPNFDPTGPAVYYARVLENPSCRWSTFACNALPADARPSQCSDPGVAKAVKERAWSSPIWYQP